MCSNAFRNEMESTNQETPRVQGEGVPEHPHPVSAMSPFFPPRPPQDSGIFRKPLARIEKTSNGHGGKMEFPRSVPGGQYTSRNESYTKEANKRPQKKDCFEALNSSYATLSANLQRAKKDLLEKRELLKNFEEEAICNGEKIGLMEERIRLINEKLTRVKYSNVRKEKRRDKLVSELSEATWKLEEATEFALTMKNNCAGWKEKTAKRQKQLSSLRTEPAEVQKQHKELFEETEQLKKYKEQLDSDDPDVRSIVNGSQIVELEGKKRQLNDALIENGASGEALLLDADETTEQIQAAKDSLENTKKEHEKIVKEKMNLLNYLEETERRLKKNLTYTKSRLDQGMLPQETTSNAANVRESFKYKI